jgi:hypothetical protein
MDTEEKTITVVFIEDGKTEINFGLKTYSSLESAWAFVDGRKLNKNEFLIVEGRIIEPPKQEGD